MDIGRLRALRELSIRKTMAAVAEALYVSPSAVSQQIALLEEELGISLIERRGRGVVLTLAGEQLVERTERILVELESARADIAELKSVVSGELRVAAFPSVAAALIPRVVHELLHLHPRLTIQFDEMEPAESLAALRSWQTDIAIIDDLNAPPEMLDRNIETIPLTQDVFNVMVSKDHRLAERPTVKLQELSGERWATDTASETYTRMLVDACQAAGFKPNIVARCKSFEVTIALIRQGYGISMLPGLRASHDLEDVWVCKVVPEIRRRISLAFRKGEKRSPAFQALVSQIIAHTRS
ncbi:LysR family transcriptional regulator [Chelatococcus asaccharovorans]|uniref:LysR family transcriptional regulator n=1 Tax=Chelatococcus asaccharovorans TaxID=28210 RepID=UPI00224C6CC4|nr:LysR family transcriptional regulator [Chelatococcus asaccharovorans]CAH1653061.1 LysR family transcriptional regulator [Chelatococcus asaccharovorans]CAH1686157.1 LysR family transcriptional regulator [Chelatococcus asaccharovorans]